MNSPSLESCWLSVALQVRVRPCVIAPVHTGMCSRDCPRSHRHVLSLLLPWVSPGIFSGIWPEDLHCHQQGVSLLHTDREITTDQILRVLYFTQVHLEREGHSLGHKVLQAHGQRGVTAQTVKDACRHRDKALVRLNAVEAAQASSLPPQTGPRQASP